MEETKTNIHAVFDRCNDFLRENPMRLSIDGVLPFNVRLFRSRREPVPPVNDRARTGA
jgi:hypothetical protein